MFFLNKEQKVSFYRFLIYFISIYQTDMSVSSEKKWVEGMFEQVSVNLHQLLDSLTYIYESHGVQYAIKQYFGTLMRLLAPIQLLANTIEDPIRQRINYPQVDSKMQKKSKKKNHENQCSSQNSQNQRQKVQKNVLSLKEHPKKNINESKKKNQENYQDQYQLLQKTNHFSEQFSQQVQQRKENQSVSFKNKKIRPSYRYGSNYSKTTLSPQEQLILCQWIREEMSKGTLITKQKIMERAKKMSKIQGFQASSGWCRRFLFRNEDIKVAIQMNKFHPDVKRKKDERNFNKQPLHQYKYWNQYNKQNDLSFEEVKQQDIFEQPEQNQGNKVQEEMDEENQRNLQQLEKDIYGFEDKVNHHNQNLMNRSQKK